MNSDTKSMDYDAYSEYLYQQMEHVKYREKCKALEEEITNIYIDSYGKYGRRITCTSDK